MSKFWPYIAAFLGGFAVAMTIAAKYLVGDDYKSYINKVKQKNSPSGIQDVALTTSILENEKTKQQLRKERRQLRKLKRKNK